MKDERWIVGAEYDGRLFAALGTSLRALGYNVDAESWGVGGSQEVSSWKVRGPKGNLLVEAETYIGLSVCGEPDLVGELRRHFTNGPPANNAFKRRRGKSHAP